jgi:SAM-dependent methyltransferase
MTGFAPLLAQLAANRFLPVPPPQLIYCGDGDYRAIGAEFLGHFVRRGGLAPAERVLDIGCGPGRIAVPLTQYLSDAGSYDGVDVVADGIAWCRASISPLYPRFRFHLLDVAHPLYNPAGRCALTDTTLPFPDAAFDFIAMVSLLTHLAADGLAHYAAEAARLLAPGGRCFVTAFLLNPPARAALRAGGGRWAVDPDDAGPVVPGDPATPLAASAFDEDFFLAAFLRAGLRRKRPAAYGHWSGRPAEIFQDVCIFERG